jgi:formylglycine-generating enzyme required for sulfatase activity
MVGELPQPFGRYQLLKKLGEGGMGVVYLAHDTELGRQVAIKVPTFSRQEDPAVLQRFRREARAAAVLQHRNIWGLYDVYGNVREWCDGWRGSFGAAPLKDPVLRSPTVWRLARGGAYCHAWGCRSAMRPCMRGEEAIAPTR